MISFILDLSDEKSVRLSVCVYKIEAKKDISIIIKTTPSHRVQSLNFRGRKKSYLNGSLSR